MGAELASPARKLGVVLTAVVLVIAGLPMLTARADSDLSFGCEVVASSGPQQTSVWGFFPSNGVEFFAGEVISATFSDPHNGNITGVLMTVDDEPFDAAVIVDQDDFPGSVSYTVPADGRYKVLFAVQSSDGGSSFSATIDPDCRGGTPDFCESGRVFGEFHSSRASDGGLDHKPGSHYGYASCIHGMNFNNGKKLGPKVE